MLLEKIPNADFFTWNELVTSNTATAKGIVNIPDKQEYWDNLQYLAQNCLQPIRNYFEIPVYLHSGFRSCELNRIIGGSPTSFHSIGCAADIDFGSIKSPTLMELFLFIHDNIPFTELIAEELPEGWVHIALQKGRENERQLKYKFKNQPVKRDSFKNIVSILGEIYD